MNRFTTTVIIVASGLLIPLSPTHADSPNLLVNGNCEGVDGFNLPQGSCTKDKNWFYVHDCIPEIEPPTWWFPFWDAGPSAVDPDRNYRRPEFRVCAWADGQHYAFDGERYLLFFGFYGAIDAGIYQQVTVEPTKTYEFSYQGFAWSNCMPGKDHTSGEGCDNFPTNQAVMKAGIDPTGGTDYTSPNIIWSDGDSIYDAYDQVSVKAEAESSTITVFARCTFWHNYIQHNDAHVDGLRLTAVETPTVTPDMDGDNDVDMDDFGLFQACFGGDGNEVDKGCESADFDNDRDVDVADFDVFLTWHGRSQHPRNEGM